MLFPQRIIERLSPDASRVRVEIVAKTGSTNTDLLARVPDLDAPTLLLAESQTQGRGRGGKAWLSAPGASLTFSLAWPFAGTLDALAGLPLAAGVAMAEALREWGVPATLKWPNDIWREGRKLGGILVETKPHGGKIWAVIGIGLNLTVPAGIERQIGHPAAEASGLAQMDRHQLVAGLLNRLVQALALFGRQGFAAFADRWNRLDAHAGRLVTVGEGGAVRYEGVACGVDGMGRLLLDTAGGRLAVMSGDLSLRTEKGVQACCC